MAGAAFGRELGGGGTKGWNSLGWIWRLKEGRRSAGFDAGYRGVADIDDGAAWKDRRKHRVHTCDAKVVMADGLAMTVTRPSILAQSWRQEAGASVIGASRRI